MLGPIEDMLNEKDTLTPEQQERTEILHRNALRLLRLVNALLDFSRIEAGRVQAVYEPTDLALFTAELASSFRSAIEKAGDAVNRKYPCRGRASVCRPGDVGKGGVKPLIQRL